MSETLFIVDFQMNFDSEKKSLANNPKPSTSKTNEVLRREKSKRVRQRQAREAGLGQGMSWL